MFVSDSERLEELEERVELLERFAKAMMTVAHSQTLVNEAIQQFMQSQANINEPVIQFIERIENAHR